MSPSFRGRLTALDALSRVLNGGAKGDTPWPAVVELAREHDVMAALWTRCRADLGRLPPPVASELREWARGNTVRNARMRGQLREVVGVLAQAGSETLLIKGAVRLVDGSLGSLGDRWLADLDVVVAPERSEAARAALEAAGYRPAPGKPFLHPHELPFVRDHRPAPVEVHLELGSPPMPELLPAAEAWDRSETVEFDGLRARVLPPTLQVLHNVVHSAVQDLNHAVGGLPLRQLADLSSLVRAHGDAVDWSEIHQRMSSAGMQHILIAHLWLAHRYAALPLPTQAWCRPARRHDLWARTGFALGWPADIQRNLRFAFGRNYLDSLYGHGDRPLRLAAARVRHAWNLLSADARGAISEARIRRS